MMQENICLNISIFYSQDAWYELISKGINIWAKKILSKAYVIDFKFCLSTVRGDSIKLILIIKKEKSEKLASISDKFFRKFLSNNSSYKPENERLFCSSFFLDYPNNSIYYDLQKILPNNNSSEGNASQEQNHLKNLYIRFLDIISANETNFKEERISFIIQLQIIFLRYCTNSLSEAKKLAFHLFRTYQSYNHQVQDLSEVKLLFKEHKKDFKEYFQQFWDTGSFNLESCEEWIIEWAYYIQSIKNENIDYQKANYISTEMNFAFNIDNQMMAYLVKEIMKSINQ